MLAKLDIEQKYLVGSSLVLYEVVHIISANKFGTVSFRFPTCLVTTLYTIYFIIMVILKADFAIEWISIFVIVCNLMSAYFFFAYCNFKLSDFKPSGPY